MRQVDWELAQQQKDNQETWKSCSKEFQVVTREKKTHSFKIQNLRSSHKKN